MQRDDNYNPLGCFRGIWAAVRCELAVIAAFVAIALFYYGVGRVLS